MTTDRPFSPSFQAQITSNLPWLRAYVQRRLGPFLRSRADAEDYVQDVLLKALRFSPPGPLQEQDQVRAWLGRSVENVLRDENDRLRAQKRDARREQPVASDTRLPFDPPHKDVTRPSQVAGREEERARVRLALACLPSSDRRLIVRRDFDGASFAEIGDELGVAEEAARMRYRRSLCKLAERITEINREELFATRSC